LLGRGDLPMKIPNNTLVNRPDEKGPEQKIREVSAMYEKHFLGEMMKAMRSTVHEDGGIIQTNQAEKIFREQLDQQYVDKWGEKGGIGLADLIYNQMVDKYGVQMGIRNPVEKPKGPLPLGAKDVFTGKSFHQQSQKAPNLSYRFDRNILGAGVGGDGLKPLPVSNPWDGVLLGKKNLGNEEMLMDINHDNGLRSQLVYKGVPAGLKIGDKIQAGETLGFLSPEAKTFYWHTQTGPQPEPTVPE
jgi:flagellar protein FlgJ